MKPPRHPAQKPLTVKAPGQATNTQRKDAAAFDAVIAKRPLKPPRRKQT